LDRALKIIMRICSAYTQRHRQRRIAAMSGMLPPPAPIVDAGVRREQLRREMKVKVWWLDDWWWASIHYLPVGQSTVSVLFLGHDEPTRGILPRHIKIILLMSI